MRYKFALLLLSIENVFLGLFTSVVVTVIGIGIAVLFGHEHHLFITFGAIVATYGGVTFLIRIVKEIIASVKNNTNMAKNMIGILLVFVMIIIGSLVFYKKVDNREMDVNMLCSEVLIASTIEQREQLVMDCESEINTLYSFQREHSLELLTQVKRELQDLKEKQICPEYLLEGIACTCGTDNWESFDDYTNSFVGVCRNGELY
ncbi:MAG: hypothetical protein HOG08_02345 [Candidatus Magasanikbacteria bacterium]|nr:hypothetical protein [Candidatus Magasanikbacteria bacterium]